MRLPRSILTAVVFASCVCRAEVRLMGLYGDHAVLQRDKPITLRGTATPAATLTIKLGTTTAETVADFGGRWEATLPAMPADATPRDLIITGDGLDAVVRDVVVGDVWLCAGQSNMGYALAKATGGVDAVAASADPLLRECTVTVDGAPTPQSDVTATWRAASPQTSGTFSAVGYFFATKLRRELGVPIGIVHASLGGTPIEAWSRRASLDGVGQIKSALKKSDATLKAATRPASDLTRKTSPGWLYNGAIAPIVGTGLRGVCWYQGESNVDNADDYRVLFPLMIRDWRQRWGDASLPFLFVQLAARDPDIDEPYGSPTADLRRAQTEALDLKNTAMVVAIDTRADDWHPPDKRPIGERLAGLALKVAHGQSTLKTSGPLWAGRLFKDDVAVIRFVSEGGLRAPDDKPGGFMIAGDDRRFVRADATIVGDTVELTAEGVDRPVAVRYGWGRGTKANLTNAAGLPAAPFRTDNWPTPTTKPEKAN